MMNILNAIKKAEFTYDTVLRIDGKRINATFLGTTHDEVIYYYTEEAMVLHSFEHWTALNKHSFHYIMKGFIAGKGWR